MARNTVRSAIRSVLAWVVALALLAQPALAQVPELINYQSRLTNSAGLPLNGAQSLVFRVYDAETAGTLLAETAAIPVTANQGLVSAKIPAAASLFSGPGRWLEVAVNGETLSPRTQLLSVPYAFRSASSSNEALLTYRLMGISLPRLNVDGGAVVPATGRIVSASLFRRVPGSSGSTMVDIHRNGFTIFTNQGNRPSLAFNAGISTKTVTNMDVTQVGEGDVLTCDVDAVEGGNPEDIVVTVRLRAD